MEVCLWTCTENIDPYFFGRNIVLKHWFQVLLYTDEGVYVDSNGKVTKNVVLQWGELPTSVGKVTPTSHTTLSSQTTRANTTMVSFQAFGYYANS